MEAKAIISGVFSTKCLLLVVLARVTVWSMTFSVSRLSLFCHIFYDMTGKQIIR